LGIILNTCEVIFVLRLLTSKMPFCYLFSFSDYLFLILGANFVGYYFPSVHCTWWILRNTLGKSFEFFLGPVFRDQV
jgi:hypothetical protein